ncbi:cytosine permease [Escherichia coli]
MEINGKSDSIYLFLDIIGGMLRPVIGVMMAHYFVVMRRQLILMNCIPHLAIIKYHDNGFNLTAFSVTPVAVIYLLAVSLFTLWNRYRASSWFVGVIVALRPTPY